MRLTIHPLQRFLGTATTLALTLLAACATYTPLPLDGHAALRDGAERLARATDALPERLNMDDVVMLTLLNNPDLVAARAQRGLARAQVLAAGILPNPSLSGSYGFLLGGPGTTDALAAGISQDLKSLVTLSSNRASAR